MANNSENITYKITVDAELGVATVRNLKGQIVATKVPVKELRKEFGNFANTVDSVRFDKFKKGLDTATKSNQNLRTASGAATSSVMELGRVISDAPYGIRGMANNITQLVSQMGFAVKATGSLKLALKEMWSALMGPLGVVLAITAAVSALDFFAGSQEKSKKETDKNTESLKKQITPLEKLINLYSSLKRVLFTSKDNEAINAFNKNFLSLDETVKVLTRNFSEFKNAYDKLSDDDKKNKESVKALVDGYSELLELRELEEKQVSRMSVLRADVDKKGRTISRNGLKFLREEAKELDSLETSYIKTQKRLIRLEDFFAKPDKEETKVIAKDFVETLYNEIAGIADVVADEDFDGISDTAKITGKLILPFKPTFVPPEEDFYAELDRFIERYQTVMTGLTSFVDGEFERQLTIEKNKTNILNEELNNRLLNESLSADQRKAIQNEIAQNDERLRVRQEAIKKKAFNTEKAFNISAALIETYAAASSAYKNTLANPINKLLPDAGLLRAKINAGVATAGGLLQVAAIARQKYQSSSAATPVNVGGGGASGGASERAEPSFNIVGRSGENLLINAIQAQFGKPLKAYVVSRDITTQQQLDGMIVGQAGT
jgi:hypothetical protein